jgi:hypothetical protein
MDTTFGNTQKEVGTSSSPLVDQVIQNSKGNNEYTTSVQEALADKHNSHPVTGTGTAGVK